MLPECLVSQNWFEVRVEHLFGCEIRQCIRTLELPSTSGSSGMLVDHAVVLKPDFSVLSANCETRIGLIDCMENSDQIRSDPTNQVHISR